MSEDSKGRIVTLVGIDLAKNSFHVHGVDAQCQPVFSKKLSRATFSPKQNATRRWAAALKTRRHTNVAVVALTNKVAPVADAVMASGKPDDLATGKPTHAAA